MKKEEKQGKMNFSFTYKKEEMGILGYGSKEIYLFDSFLRDKLGASSLDTEPIFAKKDKLTKVGCPFCNEGFLKLDSIKPNYSGGPGRTPRTLHHSGNSYRFICSNEQCRAIFYGSIKWLYID